LAASPCAGFLGSAAFYVPALPAPRRATDAVRDAFRSPRGAGDVDAGLHALRLLQVRAARRGASQP
jgi:hypothetical protein